MSKYIIELDDRIKLVTSVGVTENGVVYTTSDYVHNLEELNSDYINEHYGELQETAYKKGLHDGESKCGYCNEYQRGLNDAWEAAKKIVVDTDNGGIAMGTLCEIFDTRSYSFIMRENTAQEAIAKLKAYEDGNHSDRIEVGDEVEDSDGDKAIVTNIHGNMFDGLCSDGFVVSDQFLDDNHKTGKHYDIASILEAMRK